jgi:hypothetical protein
MARTTMMALPTVCVLALTMGVHAAEKLVPAAGASEPDPTPDGQPPILELSFIEADRLNQSVPRIVVSIHADGTVLIPDAADDAPPLRGRLSRERLSKLLDDVIETDRILDCETRRIEEALTRESRRTGLAWRVPGAAATLITVRWQGRTHDVRCPAAELLEARFSTIDELHRLCAVQRRLQNVKCLVQAGGVDAAERLAALANRELRSRSERPLSVTVDDLQLVRSSGDGLRYAQFVVSGNAAEGDARPLQMVSVMESPGANPRVSVTSIPPSRP